MKKIFITFSILLFAAVPAFSAQQVEEMYDELLNMDQNFFKSSVVPSADVTVEEPAPAAVSSEKYVKHMPWFKKTRLRVQYAWKMHDKKSEEKQALREAERAEREALEEEDGLKALNLQFVEYGENNEQDVNLKSKDINQEDKTGLVGGVREQVTENEMVLDCDEVKTDDETGDMEALGNPVLTLPQQKIKLTADKMIYNRDSNILKAMGNVVLTKDGQPVYGDYMQVNMNEENIFMDNIIAAPSSMKIAAKKAVSEADKLFLEEGKMYSDKSNVYRFVSRMVGPDFRRMIIDDEDMALLMQGDHDKFRISASKVNVKGLKDHDTLQMKDAEVYYNNRYLFTIPSITAHANKSREVFEANYPEFGSRSRLGMFIGPGVVFDAPFGSIIKVIPMLNYKSGLGYGGAVKYLTSFNETQFMYGSASDTFVLKGRQQLDENLYLQYGSNAYLDDWFMGTRMPKYMAELVYDKQTHIDNFLADGLGLNFRQRAAAAYAQDGTWNIHREHIKSSGTGTTRFKYMAEVNQNLYSYIDKENRKAVKLSLVMQGSAGLYGTGDTQFVARVGPRLHTQYKYWMQDIGYFVTGYSDHTPMPVFDRYRYGHSMVYLNEALRLNKYLTLGWSGYLNLSGDSPNGEMFQENRFIVSLGPDDFKVNLGYDFMRQTTYFAIALALDTKGTSIEFDKMEIKNPERIGNSERKEDENVAFEPKTGSPVIKRLQYAEVIDIEDPDRESI